MMSLSRTRVHSTCISSEITYLSYQILESLESFSSLDKSNGAAGCCQLLISRLGVKLDVEFELAKADGTECPFLMRTFMWTIAAI